MSRPNLFSYATSELSQDAALCWLLAWAQPEAGGQEPHLHELAISLIRTCYEKHDTPAPERINSARIHRQFTKIDVLAVINEETLHLVEDKVFSKEHSDQLARYRQFLEISGEYSEMRVLPIYVQTGEQSDYSAVEDAGYKVLRRHELIQLLNHAIAQGCENAIVVDFHDHLVRIEEDVQSYRTALLGEWSGRAWQGFFGALRVAGVPGSWGYVPNRSGGFWGFWWGWQDGSAYLLLQEDLLCYKIWIPDADSRSNAKYSWSERVVRAGQEKGLNVVKPARLRSADNMTIAVLGDYRITTGDRTLDLESTIRFLRRAEEVLASAAAQGV